MAWFCCWRPTWRTRIGASIVVVGIVASAASVATRIWASPERAASAPASRRASPRSPVDAVSSIESIARRIRPMSVEPVATTRAVRPAAMTLALPPDGRSRSASIAACFAAPSRSGTTSVAPMLADASTTRTMSRARPAGRSMNGRAARIASAITRSSCNSNNRLRRSRCHGALASTSATSRFHSSVDGTIASSRRSFRRYIATTAGTNSRPSSASGVAKGIG